MSPFKNIKSAFTLPDPIKIDADRKVDIVSMQEMNENLIKKVEELIESTNNRTWAERHYILYGTLMAILSAAAGEFFSRLVE